MTTAASMKETVIHRKGYPLTERAVEGFRVVREPRQFVRRTVTLELSLDRRVRAIIAGKCSYSDAMEEALGLFVAKHETETPSEGQTVAVDD